VKLIYCTDCHDVVRLVREKRRCKCGKCGGYYKDHFDAVYWGAPAVPLGFANNDLLRAVGMQPEQPGPGERFEAFVIPKKCSTMEKIDTAQTLPHGIKFRQPGEPRNVHTEHCCIEHGCKYSHDDCPVVAGKMRQSHKCETCHFDEAWEKAIDMDQIGLAPDG